MTGKQRHGQFESLLHEHRRIVLKVASVYARQPQDQQDLAQEISVQLWRSFGSFDAQRAKFSTWMYRIALNVAISQLRRHGAGLAGRVEPLQPHHLEIVGDEVASEPDERLAEMHAVIGALDPLNRALIVLYLEDRSYAEIADVLGISETNVATKINRIKHRLRGQMTAATTTGA